MKSGCLVFFAAVFSVGSAAVGGFVAAGFHLSGSQPSFLTTQRRRNCRPRHSTFKLPMEALRTLYPSANPLRNGTLAVDETHTLFYQEFGSSSNPTALNALFLHGGPGAGCSPNHARFFDPTRYRVVLLDQRGSGWSTPRGEAFVNNTIHHLVQDCEILRCHLGIDQWDVVLGGSWGTTLALAYAQEYPTSVRSLVLRGVCLLRPQEVDWLTNRFGGAAAMDPDGWREFSGAVGVEPSNDLGRDALHAYYDRLLGTDSQVRLNAARSWMMWEMRVSAVARRLIEEKRNATGELSEVLVWNLREGWRYCDSAGSPILSKSRADVIDESRAIRKEIGSIAAISFDQTKPRPISPIPSDRIIHPVNTTGTSNETSAEFSDFIPAQAILTCYYSVNSRYALHNINLLCPERISRIRHIRCIAVQGGMDAICPPDTALDLRDAWPEMELRIPTISGHSMYDSDITNELIHATDRLARELDHSKIL